MVNSSKVGPPANCQTRLSGSHFKLLPGVCTDVTMAASAPAAGNPLPPAPPLNALGRIVAHRVPTQRCGGATQPVLKIAGRPAFALPLLVSSPSLPFCHLLNGTGQNERLRYIHVVANGGNHALIRPSRRTGTRDSLTTNPDRSPWLAVPDPTHHSPLSDVGAGP